MGLPPCVGFSPSGGPVCPSDSDYAIGIRFVCPAIPDAAVWSVLTKAGRSEWLNRCCLHLCRGRKGSLIAHHLNVHPAETAGTRPYWSPPASRSSNLRKAAGETMCSPTSPGGMLISSTLRAGWAPGSFALIVRTTSSRTCCDTTTLMLPLTNRFTMAPGAPFGE
jgi:hypothetical protein